MSDPDKKTVRHFRQILLWPLELMPIRPGAQIQRHWELLEREARDNPWREVEDEFGDPEQFRERHYNEFVSFLPYVQRFLYGEGGKGSRPSPMRVFRRKDVAGVRLALRAGEAPLHLAVAHVDLYFFLDIDVVLLNVEVYADELPLGRVEELLYRFGRAYPAAWEEDGQGQHCVARAEWLAADGRVLAASDYERREKFLAFACRQRTARIADHWAFLLKPLVLDRSEEQGLIRYRQIEYYRMPVMAWLAMEDPAALSRADFVRLGLVAPADGTEALPYPEAHLADFESRYCYDRYWSGRGGGLDTRWLGCGHALLVVGDARSALFTHPETGVLAQFRHQHFLLFLIAHLQKAALLLFSERLVEALDRLDIHDAESVRRFKRAIRQTFEIFLRFTHRYWFHELSDQAQTRALFRMTAAHLGLDPLYDEVKQEIADMSQYLDTDTLRRQANTVVRLTVVTTFGLIGTVTTGFLGMNLIAAGDAPLAVRVLLFLAFFVPTAWLTFYTVVKSKRLSDFLEALSDERLPARAKLGALAEVWRRGKTP